MLFMVSGFEKEEWDKEQENGSGSPSMVFADAGSGQAAVAGVREAVQGFVPTGVMSETDVKSLVDSFEKAKSGEVPLIIVSEKKLET